MKEISVADLKIPSIAAYLFLADAKKKKKNLSAWEISMLPMQL